MRGRTAFRTAATAGPIAAAAATVLGLALLVEANGLGAAAHWGLASNVSAALALLGVGTVLVRRPAGRRIGLLLLGCGAAMAVNVLAGGYAAAGGRHGWPAAPVAQWATTWLWALTVIPLTTVLPAVFPDGGALTPRWRPVLVLGWTATAAMALVDAVTAGPVAGQVAGAWWGVAGFGALLALVFRWRRAGGVGRQQLKFLLLAFGIVVVVELVHSWLPYHVAQAAFFAIPLMLLAAVGLAVLKYRLYDIDVVISRSVVYGTLTAVVVGVYLLVTGLGGALLGSATALPGVVTAALVAVGLTPARHRLQRAVDRLLYGDRREPLRAVSRLGDSVAETGGPDLLGAVLAGVKHAVQAAGVTVLAPDGRELGSTGSGQRHDGSGLRDGESVALRVGGSQVGVLRVAARGPGESYSDADRGLLAALAPSVAVVVRALQLTRELEVERDRVVTAIAAERDRVRRDLHDGLGPSLLGVRLGLDALADAARARDSGAARHLLDRIRAEVGTAVGEVRRILDELPLAPS